MKIYEALAQTFVAEGVDTLFTLMGTANMHWATAMKNVGSCQVISTRHEHTACAAAMGYYSATGKVGVASVTCGPGLTQTMTALTSAVRNSVPMVVFAGEAPINSPWYEQGIDQAPFVTACGAIYIAGHSKKKMHQYVRDAFYLAKTESKPVVLGIPYDLQKEEMLPLPPYVPTGNIIPVLSPIHPAPEDVRHLAELLASAECPVILAGKGALVSDAAGEIEELADRCGAMLTTTLLVKGMFDHHPFSLGVAGGFARSIAREISAKADLVVAFGASLSNHTLDAGHLFPKARIVQVDARPTGMKHARAPAHDYVRADARLAAAALSESIAVGSGRAGIRSDELARRIAEEPADAAPYPVEQGLLDPRDMYAALEGVIPGDFDIISGTGHYAYFHTPMRGYDPRKYHSMRSFGAVGNALPYALGVAIARGNDRVVLFDGDGGLAMYSQEFETIRRTGVKMLIICCNDGAYGSEIHKLRGDNVDDSGAIFGRPDFEQIAKGYGLGGATVTDVRQFADLMRDYEAADTTQVWNVLVSDQVISPYMRGRVSRDKSAAPSRAAALV